MRAAASALALALAAPAAAQEHEATDHGAEHGDHGDMVMAPPDPDALFNAEDLQFLHHMSMHHQQALDMSALVPGRAEHEAFAEFARYVARAQAAEINAMQALLNLAERRGLSAPHHMMEGDPPMAGMLSSAEMEALAAAEGAAFERRWMEGMIFHHEGGLAMARAQQLQQLANRRQPYGLQVLVEDIIVEQRAEITKMRGWLEEWELANDADARVPAAEVSSPVPGAAAAAGTPVRVYGVAVDDRDVAGVEVTIRDLDSGEAETRAAELVRSGPSSAAWTLEWTPPAPGRYAIAAEAEDTAGKRAGGFPAREVTVR